MSEKRPYLPFHARYCDCRIFNGQDLFGLDCVILDNQMNFSDEPKFFPPCPSQGLALNLEETFGDLYEVNWGDVARRARAFIEKEELE